MGKNKGKGAANLRHKRSLEAAQKYMEKEFRMVEKHWAETKPVSVVT